MFIETWSISLVILGSVVATNIKIQLTNLISKPFRSRDEREASPQTEQFVKAFGFSRF